MNPAFEEATITREPTLTSITGLEHLLREDAPDERATRTGAAVVYLRVSTTRQMNTAADLDEDGNSIATQREWTLKKAKELRVPVLREFVEPGQSAQTIDKRPEFKKLLRFIDSNPDVRYVVIYMRSRVFRNHLDAAIVKRSLREKGVELISAKENFGDGYMGDAMEAITDVVNELQVRMSGEDIKIKMAHKVERGGTVSRAKLGYLNARKDFDGRLVNTIDVDPVRASAHSVGVRAVLDRVALDHAAADDARRPRTDHAPLIKARGQATVHEPAGDDPPRPVLHRRHPLQGTPLPRTSRADHLQGAVPRRAEDPRRSQPQGRP